MKHIFKYMMFAVGLLTLNSCIKNDIPYPRIQANFATFEVADEYAPALIDTVNRTVTVYLPESANPAQVKVLSYSLSPEGVTLVGGGMAAELDLRQSYSVILKLYQEYEWTIAAVRPIERYFTIEGQIGQSTIDEAAHRVIVKVPDSADLAALKVTSMKLGPTGSLQTPDMAGGIYDFTNPVKVVVTSFGEDTEWEIYVEPTKANVTTERADAWTCVAWVYGVAQAGKDNGVEYKKVDDSSWIKVPEDWLTSDGGNFKARILHLTPMTEYVARAYSGDEYGAEINFTTGSEVQAPNHDLGQWWLDGKVWCPWTEGGEKYWDTGNKGATTLGQSNSVPTDDTSTGTGKAAMLQSKFVGVGPLGKLAAGNLFTGDYVKTVGTNGILSFGRPFCERPTRLRGHLKYHSAEISQVSNSNPDFRYMKGEPDTCIVWMALSDAANPYEIRTNPSDRQLFDRNDESVVAYGQFQSGKDITDYTEFTIDLEYNSTSRIPRYIVIVCSASKYGDYFTGGNGSVLCVDDLELLYDY